MFDKRKTDKQGSLDARNTPTQQVEQAGTSQPARATSGGSAVIGSGIKINGDIGGNEDLIIKGEVDGSIKLEANEVEIDKAARVTADVTAKVVRIAGTVIGNIIGIERVVIASSGDVRGNISAPRVMLEDGARFKGSIDMDPRDKTAAELPVKQNKSASGAKPVTSKQEASLELKTN